MGADKKGFERVKDKLREFRQKGMFKNIELSADEEDEDDTINSLNKLNKLLDQTQAMISEKEKDHDHYRNLLEQTKNDKKKEVDDLVDEYNLKDEELQNINERYIGLKREIKSKMYELAK